jgi:hypothetical protein
MIPAVTPPRCGGRQSERYARRVQSGRSRGRSIRTSTLGTTGRVARPGEGRDPPLRSRSHPSGGRRTGAAFIPDGRPEPRPDAHRRPPQSPSGAEEVVEPVDPSKVDGRSNLDADATAGRVRRPASDRFDSPLTAVLDIPPGEGHAQWWDGGQLRRGLGTTRPVDRSGRQCTF